jgi:hypothetical protein
MSMSARYLVDTTVLQFHHDGMSPFRNRQEFKEFWTFGEMGDAIRSGEISREESDELIRSAWEDLPLALKE